MAVAALLWGLAGSYAAGEAKKQIRRLAKRGRKTAEHAERQARELQHEVDRRRRRPDPLKGLAAGLIGGLAAAFAMNRYHALVAFVDERLRQEPAAERGEEEQNRKEEGGDENDAPATVKAAEAISENIFGYELDEEEAEMAGPVMHYGFGASVGAVYGVFAEYRPEVTYGFGMPFGAAVWAGADELAVPAFGLADPPTEYPLSTHITSLGAHLVYGAVTELIRRSMRNAW